MHELGVVIEIVNTVKKLCAEEGIERVHSIVLQVGEISSAIPRFLEECYPAAVDGSFMEDTTLVIETVPANALCKNCNRIYRILDNPQQNKSICPACLSEETELLSGRELNIKEIVIPE